MKPETQSRGNSGHGFTVLELLIVIVILVLVVLLVLPMRNEPDGTVTSHCMNNLKNVSVGYLTWSMNHGDAFPWEVSATNGGTSERALQGRALPQFQVLSNYVKDRRIFACPRDKQRQPVEDDAQLAPDNLSYFTHLDTAMDRAMSSILAGDRQLELGGRPVEPGLVQVPESQSVAWVPGIHAKDFRSGNLAFVDGHVESSREDLPEFFRAQGMATNRLVIP